MDLYFTVIFLLVNFVYSYMCALCVVLNGVLFSDNSLTFVYDLC